MQIIDGQKIADKILNDCRQKLVQSKTEPQLAIIMVGNNPASLVYVRKKQEAGIQAGVKVQIHKFDTATNEQILDLIKSLNHDTAVYGIILQLPAPDLDQYLLCKAIDPLKDVDGLNPENFAQLWLTSSPQLIPATVKAIIYALDYVATQKDLATSEYLAGKNVLIINRSSIIGKPLAGLLLRYDATVTLAHSKTRDLDQLISNADIIVSGTGRQNFITQQKFKDDAVLIDVGFNKVDNKVFGDVNQKSTQGSIGWLTPVPGGIGPIGVACLIENVVEVFFNQQSA
jgi:methylenetetrahydrofolate dehydrogenase (NADP+)/methenyltetrahydrofolate cyclohydrolase